MKSVVLITTDTGEENDIFGKIRKKPEIRKAVRVTGRYDILVTVRGESMEQIRQILLTEIRNIDAVKETHCNKIISGS